MRKCFAKALAITLTIGLLPWPSDSVFAATENGNMEIGTQAGTKADELPEPAYLWDFDSGSNTDSSSVANQGTAGGEAILHGASIQESEISIDGTAYSDDGNSVLTLSGGDKGTSYVDLPANLCGGVSAQTGLTWSFWMKPDADIVKYSRLFSSSNSSNKMEFAFTPYADDKQWNLIFDDDPKYSHIYGTEPPKGVWTYITITIESDKVVFYMNGDVCASSSKLGDISNLRGRLDGLASYTNHALGKTTSTWGDKDCKVQLDDVAVYQSALTPRQVAELARSYGLNPAGPRELLDSSEGSYGTDRQTLTQIEELTTSSASGENVVKLWKDNKGSYYYSVSRNGKVVIECSAIGITTKNSDLTSGLVLDESSIQKENGKETYDVLQGSASHVGKDYSETSFALTKGESRVTVIFRVFEDGMAYRYEVDGDTASSTETTTVTGEASEFMLPDKATIWTTDQSPTYECYEYTRRTMEDQYETDADYSTPILASLAEDGGNAWILLSEANVYNEEKPYCASIFKTESGSKAMRMRFGRYLEQETDESFDKKSYTAKYADITEVNMQDVFHTPWRVAILSSDLEGIANSSLITDLNPDPEGDFSWVEPGSSSWSWWSTSEDAITYRTMYDYIDFAAEAGMKYCLVDFGWENWENYREKVADLVTYADKKGVGILIWYGVNKFDQPHIFDLDSAKAIEEEFAWCEEVGIKGVKVDYINSDSQFAMKVMYDLADIAAKHHLVLNYHGCTNPNGENRSYPNILSSEAVAGAENFKWSSGSSLATLVTLPYTRNVLGSMEFTPTAYRVSSSAATSGFMLAQAVVYESAVQTFAHSAYVYPGYAGLSLLADVPTSWDESRLLDGYPGENVIRARRKGENWYLGAMTVKAGTYSVPLDFLDAGETYHAYIYKDNAAGDNIEIETQEVTSNMTMEIPLLANGGCSVKFSKTDDLTTTVYDNFNYYEAEDSAYAKLSGEARVDNDAYASNLKCVGYVGGKTENTLTFQNINAEADGEYTLKIYFVSGSARDLYVKVNDDAPEKLEGLIGKENDWKAVGGTELKVELKEGKNKICLYNDADYAPNIDRIAVSKLDISEAEVVLDTAQNVNQNTPAVTVTFRGKKLTEGQHYTVTYRNNTGPGTAEAIVTGIGGFCGTVTKQFVIKNQNGTNQGDTNQDAVSKDISQCRMELSVSSTNYTGVAITPVVTVTDGTKTLIENTDYTVTYKDNVNIGTASLIVAGKGNYTGSVTKTFTILAGKGSQFASGAYKYKINDDATVAFAGLNKKVTKVNIPKTVVIGGKTFKVTSIADRALRKAKITSVKIGANVKTIGASAFMGCSKLSKVTIGQGVTTIKSNAFNNCRKLGKITIQSKNLKSVGKKALKGIKSTAKIKVPAKKLKAYKKLLKGKGQGKRVKIVK